MIKVNELRIGNKVSLNKGFEMEVTAIFKDTVYLDFKGNEGDVWEENEKDVEPIPLTEERLIKLGFEKHSSNPFWLRKKKLCISLIGKVELTSWDMQIFKIDTEVNFIHQLQNLYFLLTGEELVLKE